MTLSFILTAILAGIAAGWLMHALMLAISHQHQVPVDMVKAIGSYGTGQLGPKAARIGLIVHTIGGATLGLIYGVFLRQIGIHGHPVAILAGSVFGFFHGLIVSYVLMYWIAEHHPLERYRNATMSVGLVHLAGHIFFGTVVSLLIFIVTCVRSGGIVEGSLQ